MLNELKTLSDSIRAAGFTGVEWDDKFKEIKVKGSPCCVLALSDGGDIADIRFLPPDQAKILRTWQGGSNGECFPCFNFRPFYVLDEKEAKTLSSTQKGKAAQELVSAFVSSETPPESVGPFQGDDRNKADAKTGKCLGAVAAKFFAATAAPGSGDLDLGKFKSVFARFLPDDVAATFNRKLLAYLRRNVTPDMVAAQGGPGLLSILYSNKKGADVVVFLDLADPDCLPLASERGMRDINARLLAGKASAPGAPRQGIRDAFGVLAAPAEFSPKLPEVKLPGAIALTKLRSMNKESKCQTRYGFIDAESFPVGSEIRKAAKIALSWISSPEREGKTWAVAGQNELVFAYPKAMPPTPPFLARLLGNGFDTAGDEKMREARFEQYAADALSGLKSLSGKTSPDAEIEVFAISKADKARRKVVFYRNYSVAHLEEAVRIWNEGACNIPPIRLLKWPPRKKGEPAAKGTRPVPLDFHAPLPIASVRLAYAAWLQDGNETFEPKFRVNMPYDNLPVFDGLELFLGAGMVGGFAQRMLSLLLQGTGNLCAACGNLARKRSVLSNGRAVTHLETALPLFGILLGKLNRTKETYMEKPPYLIGKFLNLADGLHALWCRNVKANDPLPPQLLGSSFFASFQLNPSQAFGNMGLRMKPYCDWAKTNRTQDASLARWFLAEIGRVAAAIEAAGIPSRLSDADKAEMLLGYLAFTGKTNSPDTIEKEPQTQGNDNE